MDHSAVLPSAISACKNSSFFFGVSGWPAVAVVAIVSSSFLLSKWMSLKSQKQVTNQEN